MTVLNGTAGNDILTGGEENDTLNGLSGADKMSGRGGDDVYVVDDKGDVAIELANNGFDQVNSSISLTLGANLEHLALLGGATNGTGNTLNNFLVGNHLGNKLDGAAGNDMLFGNGGSDTLIGGTGNDAVVGGIGNDTYVVTDFSDTITEKANEGIDTVQSSVKNFDLGANVENLTLIGAGDIDGGGNELDNIITGNDGINLLLGRGGNDTLIAGGGERNILGGGDGNDTLIGGAGADILDAGAGNDRMAGGANDDIYTVDSTKDVVIEGVKRGLDAVNSSISYTLGANLETLVLVGVANLNGTGNALDNAIIGNAGRNLLQGGAGSDTLNGELVNGAGSDDTLLGGAGDDFLNGGFGNDIMEGGTGNDLYVVDSVADKIVELAGQGIDIIVSGALDIDLSKFANVENVNLIGEDNRNATGNALNNRLNGNDALNVLIGGAGNDILDGKAGADLLGGGLGNDTYVVTDTLDTIIEIAGEGIDLVESAVVEFSLAANIENLTLTGANAVIGRGNDLNNVITGNGGPNDLLGLGGNDTLKGGDGGDLLNGGAGNDQMIGGSGNDIYVVDSNQGHRGRSRQPGRPRRRAEQHQLHARRQSGRTGVPRPRESRWHRQHPQQHDDRQWREQQPERRRRQRRAPRPCGRRHPDRRCW